jgi:hypothetical protein
MRKLILFICTLLFLKMSLSTKSQLQTVQFMMKLNMPAWVASGYSGFRTLLMEPGSLHHITGSLTLQLVQLIIYFLIAYLLLSIKIKKTNATTRSMVHI